MTRREAQRQWVKNNLKLKGSITTRFAINHNVLRLSARIFELRKENYKIKTVIQGDNTAKYILIK